MKKTGLLFLIGFALSSSMVSAQHASPAQMKQLREMQVRQRRFEAMQHRQETLKKQQEGNIRTFVLLLDDDDLHRKLKITKQQKEKLENLDKKFDEIREKTINPEGKKLVGPERAEEVKKKKDELAELSLRCGKAVMEILTREQIDEYGRHVTQERAQRQWEKRMGIEPEKPEKQAQPEKRENPLKNARKENPGL